MTPPQERLHPDDPSGPQVGLRLVVEEQLVAPQRVPDLGDQRRAAGVARVSARLVERPAGPALLRRVHGDVGVPQQRVSVGAMLGEGDADAGLDLDVATLDDEVRAQRRAELPGDAVRVGAIGPGATTANPSSPRLATGRSCARARSRVATSRRRSSPAACPNAAFTSVKRSRSTTSRAIGRRARSSRVK